MISIRPICGFLAATLISSVSLAAPPKPVASTSVVNTETPGYSVKVEANIKGAKNLFLVVTDGGN